MNNIGKSTDNWSTMTLEILDFSEKKLSLVDINKNLLFKEHLPGLSYQDYKLVLQHLISEGIVYIDDKHLIKGTIDKSEWIRNSLANGDANIWNIVEKRFKSSNLLKKFDGQELIDIGNKGEEEVIRYLEDQLGDLKKNSIYHVSKYDDTAGYDIRSPSIKNQDTNVLLEVKTSVKQSNDFTFYLSRNEFNIGINKKSWYLVFVQITSGTPRILGHLKIHHIADWITPDICANASWQTYRVAIRKQNIIKGLP